MTFTTDARADWATMVTAHGISLSIRSRSLSSFDGDDIATYTTSDSTITGIFTPNPSEEELYNLAGRETDAEAILKIKHSDSIDKNDQIVYGTDVYDIIDIKERPDATNPVVQIAILKKVRP